MAVEGIVSHVELHSRHPDTHQLVRLIGRDVGPSLHVEVDGRHGVELAQGVPDRCQENAPYLLLVLELNLSLRGMYVDINACRVHMEGDEVWHLLAFGDEMAEGLHHSVVETGMTHEASVDKEVLRRAFLPCRFGLTHKAAYPDERRFHLHGQQLLAQLLAEDAHDALQVSARRQLHHPIPVACQGKRNARVDQSDALKLLNDVVQLRLIRFEKLPTRRDVEEKVVHLEVGTHGAGADLLRDNARTLKA